jgi:hypothetical protein
MVGCSLFTRPLPGCGDILTPLSWLPLSLTDLTDLALPFTLGPFASSTPSFAAPWMDPGLDKGPMVKGPMVIFDMHVYSITLLCCDLLLTLAFHHVTQVLFSKSRPLRVKFLSPSARMTFGMLFGVARLWALSYLNIVPLYAFMAKLSFVIGLVLGWAALVFDDGPWRSLRPNNRAALARDSILNPCATVRLALAKAPTKMKLAQRTVRRKLEQGGVVSIVLDEQGSLLYAASGPFDVRKAVELQDGRRAVELLGRSAKCTSGARMFFGYKFHAPFERRAARPLSPEQRKALLELMNGLNALLEKPERDVRVFNVASDKLLGCGEDDEDDDDGCDGCERDQAVQYDVRGGG